MVVRLSHYKMKVYTNINFNVLAGELQPMSPTAAILKSGIFPFASDGVGEVWPRTEGTN